MLFPIIVFAAKILTRRLHILQQVVLHGEFVAQICLRVQNDLVEGLAYLLQRRLLVHLVDELVPHLVSLVVIVQEGVHVFDARFHPIVVEFGKLQFFLEMRTGHGPLRVFPVEIPVPFRLQVSLLDLHIIQVLLPIVFVNNFGSMNLPLNLVQIEMSAEFCRESRIVFDLIWHVGEGQETSASVQEGILRSWISIEGFCDVGRIELVDPFLGSDVCKFLFKLLREGLVVVRFGEQPNVLLVILCVLFVVLFLFEVIIVVGVIFATALYKVFFVVRRIAIKRRGSFAINFPSVLFDVGFFQLVQLVFHGGGSPDKVICHFFLEIFEFFVKGRPIILQLLLDRLVFLVHGLVNGVIFEVGHPVVGKVIVLGCSLLRLDHLLFSLGCLHEILVQKDPKPIVLVFLVTLAHLRIRILLLVHLLVHSRVFRVLIHEQVKFLLL